MSSSSRAAGSRRSPRVVLGIFRHERLWRPLFTLSRALPGVPGSPGGSQAPGGSDSAWACWRREPKAERTARRGSPTAAHPHGFTVRRPTVALFRGCVMDTLFRHVHDATRRTLEANGYRVVVPEGQACCGALHEHAGDRAAAEALARLNVAALADAADYVVVNSAGCGALLKDYGHLLDDGRGARARRPRFATCPSSSPSAGRDRAALSPLDVAYDAPCHLQHAQRVHAAPLAVLRAIPGLRLRLLPSSDKCCGSAGIYSMLRPAMARAVLDLKIESFAAASPMPEVVATGNPGCLMQIGAGAAGRGTAHQGRAPGGAAGRELSRRRDLPAAHQCGECAERASRRARSSGRRSHRPLSLAAAPATGTDG